MSVLSLLQLRLRESVGKFRFTRIAGEASWIMVGQIAAATGGIVGVPLLTHLMRPEEYGRLALGSTLMILIQQVIMGPIGIAVQRFYSPSVEAKTLSEYLRAVASIILMATGVIAAGGAVAMMVLSATRWHGSMHLMAWSMTFAIFSGFHIVFDGIQNAGRQRLIVAWHQGLGMWLRFGMAALLVKTFGGAEMAMAGFAAANAITLFSQIFFFRRIVLASPAYKPEHSNEEIGKLRRQMWVYSRSVSSWGLFTWAQFTSDRWALQAFTTTRAVGLYQAVYQLGYYPISMASTFLNQLVQPILFQRAGAGTDEARIRNTYRMVNVLFLACIALTFVGTLTAALICKPLFHHLLPPAYSAEAYLLPVIACAAGVYAAGQVASLKHSLTVNPQSLIAPKIVTAVLGTGLNFGGAYLYGTPGVIWANLIFSTIYTLWVVAATPSLASGLPGNAAAAS